MNRKDRRLLARLEERMERAALRAVVEAEETHDPANTPAGLRAAKLWKQAQKVLDRNETS